MKAMKNNSKKVNLKYISALLKEWIANAMSAGAVKYAPYNYLKGHNLTDLLDAMERHIGQVRDGQWIDEETSKILGRPVTHLGCVGASLNMIASQLKKGTLIDDRWDYLDEADFDTILECKRPVSEDYKETYNSLSLITEGVRKLAEDVLDQPIRVDVGQVWSTWSGEDRLVMDVRAMKNGDAEIFFEDYCLAGTSSPIGYLESSVIRDCLLVEDVNEG